eukprot:GHVS01018497.1.p1 GENE.GHVS01018497.1~~GHVS01018497.1.p1  ORF type:complete len:555 (+),score=81.16 GHVS01018497.1:116-1780(+)
MERRVDTRKKNFKKTFEEPRRKREEIQVTLRKKDRDEELQKKRLLTVATDDSSSSTSGGINNSDAATRQASGGGLAPDKQKPPFRPEHIPQMVEGVMSGDPERELECTMQFRRLLSIEQSPPIQEVLDANVVPKFVEFLSCHHRSELQFEAAWAITNIASGTQDQTRVVIEHGAVAVFVELLLSPKDDVREQAVWALGNIAGDSPSCRDMVLQANGLGPLMAQLQDANKQSMLRNATWTLSNLCRGKPPPPFEWVRPALPTLAGLLKCSDCEVLTDACWALSYLSDGPNDRIQAVIDAGVAKRLVDLLVHHSALVQTPSLRTVGNIVTGDDKQTEVIIQHGAIDNLLALLDSPKRGIRKEACWTISNITAGNREQIQAVIHHGLIAPLIHLLSTADFDIKKEAAWAISNAASGGNPEQVEFLVAAGCLRPVCDLLAVNDLKIVSVALEAIESILRMGKQRQKEEQLSENPYCSIIEQCNGVTAIEQLQDTASDEVYQKSWRIIYSFFPCEDDNEMENDPGAAGTDFNFGAPNPDGGFNFSEPREEGAFEDEQAS